MKTILSTFAITTLALIGLAPEAQARPPHHHHHHSNRVYVSGHRSCGTPIYSERYLVGYDPCGEPIWGVRTVRQPYCRPEVEPRYVAPCPSPYQRPIRNPYSSCNRPYSGGGVVIQGYFGR